MPDRWTPLAPALRPAQWTGMFAIGLSLWVYWPLITALSSTLSTDPDLALFVWSMEHAPHQLAHLRNPFFTHEIFATSGGANLTFNTTAPALALLMTPFTVLFGPVVSVNLLAALTPVLNSLAAHRLLRLAAGHSGSGVIAGALLIGFSPLVLMHNSARLQIAFIAIALLLMAELWRAGDDWLCGRPLNMVTMLRAGVLAGLQLWIGTEMLAIVALTGAIAIAVAVLLRWSDGTLAISTPRRDDLGSMAVAAAAMLIVASPFLLTFVFGAERYAHTYHEAARPLFGLRVANTITPTEVTLIDLHLPIQVDRDDLGVFRNEDTGYVSVAGLALIALAVVGPRGRDQRSNLSRGAVAVIATTWLLALGPTIRWSGSGSGLPGPWRLMEHIPIVKEIIANRLSLGMFVGLGVVLAGAHSWQSRRDRVVVLVAATLAILMLPASFGDTREVSERAADVLAEQCGDELVITMPQELEQEAMAWQARADFAFQLVRGFAFRESSPPKGDYVLLDDIAKHGAASAVDVSTALEELRDHGVGCVVTPTWSGVSVANLSAALGAPIVAGDVTLWPGIGGTRD